MNPLRKAAVALSTTGVGGWATFTAVAVATELLVLRLLTRTFVHIPGANDAAPGLVAVAEVGRFAYYLAWVLLIATATLLVAGDLRRATEKPGTMPWFALWLVVFVIAAAGVRAGIAGDAVGAVVTGTAVAGAAVVVATRLARPARIPIVLFAAGFVVTAVGAVTARGNLRLGSAVTTRDVGELVALIAAVSAPLLLPRPPARRSVLWGLVAAIGLIAALAAQRSTTTTLMLWNFGFAGALPSISYGIALGTLVCTVHAFLTSREPMPAVALVLLLAGGLGLHSTYQSALVLVGLVLLSCSGRPQASIARKEPLGDAAVVSG